MKAMFCSPALADNTVSKLPAGARREHLRSITPAVTGQRKPALHAALAVAFGFGCVSAQAAVVYNFMGAPEIVSTNFSAGGPDRDAAEDYRLSGPPLSRPGYRASLEFAAPLAAGATTSIYAEYGRLDLLSFGSPAGGVLSFSASAPEIFGFPFTIASMSADYLDGAVDDDAQRLRYYSYVTGQVTTDAAGDISDWALRFYLLGGNMGETTTVCTGPGPSGRPCVPSVGFSNTNLQLEISSGPETAETFDYLVVNGSGPRGTLNFNRFDRALADAGEFRVNSFTGAVGSWTSTRATVAEPGTLALMLLGGGLGLIARRRQNRKDGQA